jgi:hypothetical protein
MPQITPPSGTSGATFLTKMLRPLTDGSGP